MKETMRGQGLCKGRRVLVTDRELHHAFIVNSGAANCIFKSIGLLKGKA